MISSVSSFQLPPALSSVSFASSAFSFLSSAFSIFSPSFRSSIVGARACCSLVNRHCIPRKGGKDLLSARGHFSPSSRHVPRLAPLFAPNRSVLASVAMTSTSRGYLGSTYRAIALLGGGLGDLIDAVSPLKRGWKIFVRLQFGNLGLRSQSLDMVEHIPEVTALVRTPFHDSLHVPDNDQPLHRARASHVHPVSETHKSQLFGSHEIQNDEGRLSSLHGVHRAHANGGHFGAR